MNENSHNYVIARQFLKVFLKIKNQRRQNARNLTKKRESRNKRSEQENERSNKEIRGIK